MPEASIVAILGPNGAGKTTVLRALSGFLPSERAALTAGEVRLHGRPIHGLSPHQAASEGLLLVPERNKVFATLTVDENLAATPTRNGGNRADMQEVIAEVFPVLSNLGGRKAGLLSGGERQMLAISKALIADPTVLLIDELSLGIAPFLVVRMMRSLQKIRELRRVSILIVEQNAAAALSVADNAYIMQTGSIVLEGPSAQLQDDPNVQRMYLGQSAAGEQRRYGRGMHDDDGFADD